MKQFSLRSSVAAVAAALGALCITVGLTGCLGDGSAADDQGITLNEGSSSNALVIPSGTVIQVSINSELSSEHVEQGSSWSGVTTAPVTQGDQVAIPAGSAVTGIISGVRPAERGDRAMLDLTVTQVVINGAAHDLYADTQEIVAGSTRARNLGAIAGGAAAGALIGKAVGGDGKDAAIGGVIGGAAATGAVAASKGYQVVLKEGTTLSFTVSEQVAVR